MTSMTTINRRMDMNTSRATQRFNFTTILTSCLLSDDSQSANHHPGSRSATPWPACRPAQARRGTWRRSCCVSSRERGLRPRICGPISLSASRSSTCSSNALPAVTGRSDIALQLGMRQSFRALGPIGRLMSHAPTLGDALTDFVSFQIDQFPRRRRLSASHGRRRGLWHRHLRSGVPLVACTPMISR